MRRDYVLLAYQTAFKISIGMSSYQLVYEKTCNISVGQELNMMWAMNKLNLDLTEASEQRLN